MLFMSSSDVISQELIVLNCKQSHSRGCAHSAVRLEQGEINDKRLGEKPFPFSRLSPSPPPFVRSSFFARPLDYPERDCLQSIIVFAGELIIETKRQCASLMSPPPKGRGAVSHIVTELLCNLCPKSTIKFSRIYMQATVLQAMVNREGVSTYVQKCN